MRPGNSECWKSEWMEDHYEWCWQTWMTRRHQQCHQYQHTIACTPPDNMTAMQLSHRATDVDLFPSHSSPLSSIPLLLFPSPKNQLWDQGGTISSENCGWMLTYEDIRYKFTLLTLQLDKSWWRLPPWWTQVLKIGGARTPGLRRNRCLCIEPDRKVSRAVLQYANHRVNHRQDARTGSQA